MNLDPAGHPILVADDDPDAVACLQHLFAQARVLNPVHVVADGVEAIRFLEQSLQSDNSTGATAPCLLLLDLHMPRKNGFDVLEWLREHELSNALVIAVHTSTDDPELMRRATELGAHTFLIKYPTKATLAFIVEHAARRQAEMQLAVTPPSHSAA